MDMTPFRLMGIFPAVIYADGSWYVDTGNSTMDAVADKIATDIMVIAAKIENVTGHHFNFNIPRVTA